MQGSTDRQNRLGVITEDIRLYSDALRPSDALCDIVATEVSSIYGKPSTTYVPEGLFTRIHQPFRDLFNITLAQIRKKHDAPEAASTKATGMISHQSSNLIHPDRRLLLQSEPEADAVDSHVNRHRKAKDHRPASSQLQPRDVIVIDSDDDDPDVTAHPRPSASSKSNTLQDLPAATAPDFAYHFTVSDAGMAKHLSTLESSLIKDLIINAVQGPTTPSKNLNWITALNHSSNGDLDIHVATQENFDRLQRFHVWAPSFRNKITELRGHYTIFVGKVCIAGMGDIKHKIEKEAVIQRLFKLNQSRLKEMVSAYEITNLRWLFKPTNLETIDEGVMEVEFAFDNTARETLTAGILWDGKVHPCSRKRHAFSKKSLPRGVAACPPHTLPRCGHCQRRGHLRETCVWSPRCCHCAGNHLTKRCTAKTKRCSLCNGPHDWGQNDCPERHSERAESPTAEQAAVKPAASIQKGTIETTPSLSLANPNLQTLGAIRPSARERSASVTAADTTSDVYQTARSSLEVSNNIGKYKFTQPVAEYRPISQTQWKPPERQASTLSGLSDTMTPSVFGQPSRIFSFSQPSSNINQTRPVFGQRSSTFSFSQPTSGFSQPSPIFGQPSKAFHPSQPTSNNNLPKPVFGQTSNIVPRSTLPSTKAQDPAVPRELRDLSNEDPSASKFDITLRQLRNMRNSVISGQRPKPNSQAQTSSTAQQSPAPATQNVVPPSAEQSTLKRGFDENTKSGTVRDQESAVKRVKFEEAAQASGLSGLWMPR